MSEATQSMHDICPACLVGRMRLTTTTFVQVLDGTLIHAPNTTAWQCDTCGETYFADATLRRIEALIGTGGLPPNRHEPAPRESLTPPGEAPAARDESAPDALGSRSE